ncbi:AMP-binding protein [Subtercola sp. YIM 133946]|uniref:AMP-binding protein n=1 Tax=Subtercola sp. YIM 133946 TaxID=3118909 RepID=UPI002F93BB27
MIHATYPHPRSYDSSATFSETVGHAFLRAVAAAPDAPYVDSPEGAFSFAEIYRRAARLQLRLQAAGVERGDVVAVQLPNWWETIVAFYAAWGLGAIVNPITPIYRTSELSQIFATSRPRAVLAPKVFRGTAYAPIIHSALVSAGADAALLLVRDDSGEPPAHAPSAPEFIVVDADPDDVAMLMYTSGTTGRAKGVLHSHRTLLYEADSIGQVFGPDATTVFMPSPLSHITGMLYGVLTPMLTRGRVVLQDQWSPEVAVDLIEAASAAAIVAATPFLRGLIDAYRDRGTTSSLQTFICGGADIPADLISQGMQVMGTRVLRTYGSTEMPTLSIVRPSDGDDVRFDSEGAVIGEAAARTVDADEQQGIGSLEVHGPELFVGYLDPADNERAFTTDGWFVTGDLASISDGGTVRIRGRLKDLIVRGGENISAKEVEDFLLGHPDIDDVAVVGFADEILGERACAVVVTRRPDLGLADLVAHLKAVGIAQQKYPEALLVVEQLTRTVSGKVQKFELRKQVADALSAGRLAVRQPATRQPGEPRQHG